MKVRTRTLGLWIVLGLLSAGAGWSAHAMGAAQDADQTAGGRDPVMVWIAVGQVAGIVVPVLSMLLWMWSNLINRIDAVARDLKADSRDAHATIDAVARDLKADSRDAHATIGKNIERLDNSIRDAERRSEARDEGLKADVGRIMDHLLGNRASGADGQS